MFPQCPFMPLIHNLGHLNKDTVARPQLPRIIGLGLGNIEIKHQMAQGHLSRLALTSQLSLIPPLIRLAKTRAAKVGHFLTVEWTKDTGAHPGHPPRPAPLRNIRVLLCTETTKAGPTHPIERNITTKARGKTRIDLHSIPGTNTPNPIDLDPSPRA